METAAIVFEVVAHEGRELRLVDELVEPALAGSDDVE